MARTKKLKRLPPTHRISKRPLLRQPIPSPYTNAKQAKIVYISSKTPFISAVKRVRKLLEQVEKRTLDKAGLLDRHHPRSDQQRLESISVKSQNPEAIYLRATGRAIEKAMNLALYFQGQPDCQVELKTGSVGTVDDVVEVQTEAQSTDVDRQPDDDVGATPGLPEAVSPEAPEEVPETQVRMASFLEVAVRLR